LRGVLRGVGPRRGGRGRRSRRVDLQVLRERRRPQGVRRFHPGARRHRLHVGVRPAPLHEAGQGARAPLRRRGVPPRADRPSRRGMTAPLAGVRVVDLTSYIAGSYGAMMLADMGAGVIKVEALEGDSFRELPGFFGWNRGKRSIALNLKHPDGRAIVHRLTVAADVVMENLRPGVVERLGVDYQTLRALNPRIVYSSVTAFGSHGPYRDQPGFDPLLQAEGGVMATQGF